MASGLPPYTYIWHDANGAVVGNGNLDLTNVYSGAYSLTIIDANGCSPATTVGPFTVASTTSVVAAFTANPVSGETPLTVNFTNNSTGATNYLWLFGTGDTSSTVNPTYIYKPVGDFKACLAASNSYGCYDTACSSVDISVYSVFIIPNIFTPNGDGNNDIFTVFAKGLKSIDAEIYNRWGQKLYEWHTINGGWNGLTASGIAAAEGTYYYIIKATMIDGKDYSKQGFFSLQR
jgi:gliding motility-associated-like protein